ncbi:MAG: hypothetical protein ACHQPI_08495 [Thermoanaerobaculia bacterium]
MGHPNRIPLALALLSALLLPATAHAQWVFVARKALGKIETMTQKENTGAPGYSVATVILSGSADKVYATALKTAQASPKARLTQQDPEKHTLEFIVSGQVAGLRVSQVDSKKVQILIASAVAPGQPDMTSAVVEATLRVCKELGVACEVAK